MFPEKNSCGCFGSRRHFYFAFAVLLVVFTVVFKIIIDSQAKQEVVPKKVVWVVPEPTDVPEFVDGVVAEVPIPLGGGICLVGVSIGNSYNRWREVRAVLVSAERPLVIGQKVKVKIRQISETRRPVRGLLVIQDEIPK